MRVGGRGSSARNVSVTDVEGPRYQTSALECRMMLWWRVDSTGLLMSPPAKYCASSKAFFHDDSDFSGGRWASVPDVWGRRRSVELLARRMGSSGRGGESELLPPP